MKNIMWQKYLLMQNIIKGVMKRNAYTQTAHSIPNLPSENIKGFNKRIRFGTQINPSLTKPEDHPNGPRGAMCMINDFKTIPALRWFALYTEVGSY